MSAPQTLPSIPLPIDMAALSPCPACSAPLVDDLHKLAASCRACGAVVGSPGRFVDERRKRKPLRPAFTTGPLRACCRCKQSLQRVLVDDVAGSFCACCNLVIVGKAHAPRLHNIDATRVRVQTEAPKDKLRPRDWLAVALLLTAIGFVSAVEMGLLTHLG